MPRSKARLTLPDNPNLEQLREQAKERLVIIRTHAPDAQLSDAQFALAQDYGFSGWRALKAHIDQRGGGAGGLAGHYAWDEAIASNTVSSITVQGQKLFVQKGLGATTQIVAQPDGAYMTPGLTTRYRFERDAAGKARALIIETEAGASIRAPRIGAEKAARMRTARDEAGRKDWTARTAIEISQDAVARCVGCYANALGQVMRFSRDGDTLFMDAANQKRVTLAAESQADFFVSAARLEFHFHIAGDAALSVVCSHRGVAMPILSRVSPEAADSLAAIVTRRAAEQAQPRQAAAPVSAAILARYAGRYRIDNGLEMAFDVTDGRLFVQIVGPVTRLPRMELFPESDTKFFWTSMPAQVTFYTDADGNVAYGVLHQAGYRIAMSRIADQPAQVAPAA